MSLLGEHPHSMTPPSLPEVYNPHRGLWWFSFIHTHKVGGATLSQSWPFLIVNLKVPKGHLPPQRCIRISWRSEHFRLLFLQYSLVTIHFLTLPIGDFRRHCPIMWHLGMWGIRDGRTLYQHWRTWKDVQTSSEASHVTTGKRCPLHTKEKTFISKGKKSQKNIKNGGRGHQEDVKKF